MKILLHALRGAWGGFRRLPIATQTASAVLSLLVIVLGVTNLPTGSTPVTTERSLATTRSLETQTVGAESEAFATAASWPGEIISPNDADVQPPRSGTIVSWDVTIGEYVNAGEVLGRLSAAPLTPELAAMLAEQASAVALARSRVSSTQTYVQQSQTLLDSLSGQEAALKAIDQAKAVVRTGDNPGAFLQAIDRAKSLVEVNKEKIRTALRQSVIREFSEIAGHSINIQQAPNMAYASLSWNYGARSPGTRDQYVMSAYEAIAAAEKDEVPEKSGRAYFAAATHLIAASIASGDFVTEAKLDDVRDDIAGDQREFEETLSEYRASLLEVAEKEKEYQGALLNIQGTLLNVAEKEKEYVDRQRESASKRSELDRDIITTRGELDAAEASYRAVSGAITGGTVIVAPKSGYVSSILSQIGEFAEPGAAVASISSGVQTNKIVRFRIPSNVEVPKKGDVVKIIRPGFAKDVRSATITGVGTALDGNGAFMADARIEGAVEWPAHLSVRVVPAKRTSQTIAVPFDAVFWNEANQPRVWLVTEGGIINARSVRTGRTFGDAVEILDGLELGDTYLSQPNDTVTEGMRIEEAATPVETTAPEGDGHGHEHAE